MEHQGFWDFIVSSWAWLYVLFYSTNTWANLFSGSIGSFIGFWAIAWSLNRSRRWELESIKMQHDWEISLEERRLINEDINTVYQDAHLLVNHLFREESPRMLKITDSGSHKAEILYNNLLKLAFSLQNSYPQMHHWCLSFNRLISWSYSNGHLSECGDLLSRLMEGLMEWRSGRLDEKFLEEQDWITHFKEIKDLTDDYNAAANTDESILKKIFSSKSSLGK